MDTLGIHKLVADGLRQDPTLRWGTTWQSRHRDAPGSIEVWDHETGETFTVTIARGRTMNDVTLAKYRGVADVAVPRDVCKVA